MNRLRSKRRKPYVRVITEDGRTLTIQEAFAEAPIKPNYYVLTRNLRNRTWKP